ncbi:MAG: M14 family zinc carboxypeptidase [Luteibaculum sp.]
MRFHLILLVLLMACQTETIELPSTVFEDSNGMQSSDYQTTIDFWKDLSDISPGVSLFEVGESDAGLPIHLVLVGKEKIKDWKSLKTSKKTVLLINNGIHPGEPDGIDACQLIAKEILSGKHPGVDLTKTVLAIVPVYNIGGALNRNANSRANQNGPELYGFRGNAQNLDLNRDCIKMDSKNARALAGLFDALDPDLFFDTHVSNGADYQHVVTLLSTQEDKLGGPLMDFYRGELSGELFKRMRQDSFPMSPYVNVWGRAPQDGGIYQFMDWPRYTNGLATFHHIPAYTIETHMLKPFKDRVLGTLALIKNAAILISEKGEELQKIRSQQKEHYARAKEQFYHWEIDSSQYEEISFSGFEYRELPSALNSDFIQSTYDRDYPFDTIIPFYNRYKGSKIASKPKAFIIPAGYYEVAERLAAHGVELRKMDKDTVLRVRKARIESYETSSNAYEKHYPHYNIQLSWTEGDEKILAGSYWVATESDKDRILMETLIPDAMDSYFTWNFFDAILQQKEGYSPYVWDRKAADLLSANPDLKMKFEQKLQNEPGFRSNLNAQQYWVYQNSDHAEKAYLDYPVRFVLP